MSKEFRQFLFRVWNTVKYPLASILLALVGKIVMDVSEAKTVSVLFDPKYWDAIAVMFLSLIAGVLGVGGMAGADKLIRTRK